MQLGKSGRRIGLCFILVLISILPMMVTTACSSKQSELEKIPEAYIDGFAKFYEQGNEYTELGLQIQADYAYGWAAASISSMRYCIDCLLYLNGEGETLEQVTGQRMDNWDEIAAMNYASPYPYYFEGLVYNVQDKNEDARKCYEKALVNPAFSSQTDESLSVLLTLSVKQLKSLKKKLIEWEDKIFAVYQAERNPYPRSEFNYSDKYLRTLAREVLEEDQTNYRSALRHYKAALAVNPFDGDNFVGCALMSLYMDDMDRTFFYVNEGLYVDPEHEGLARIADILNGGVPQG
jgi:tetratricopeptide (TPR) repeat protein